MTLRDISILNFKNIAEASLDFSDNVNCFIGDNGMGKTNLLDAIYYLSFCKSYTGQGDSSLLRHGADMMMVQGRYLRREQEESVSIGYKPGRRKVVKRGGKEYDKLSRHIGLLPLVMVSPADWELIRGTGEERRRFVDQIIAQGDGEYMAHLIRYARGVENRNVMLRRGLRDPLLFETIEQQLCVSATYIHRARIAWIEEFSPIFLEYYRQISASAETVSLSYRSHLNDGVAMQEVLDRNRGRDAVLGYTSVGVHRDDVELMLDGHPMRKIGSQGQCKTYTVAMRLAQYDFMKRTNDRRGGRRHIRADFHHRHQPHPPRPYNTPHGQGLSHMECERGYIHAYRGGTAMKRTEAMTVGDIINQLLKEDNIDRQFDEQKVVYMWPEIVGQGINRYTTSRWVKNGVLYLHISSAPLRNELMMNRTTLIKHLNDAVGSEVIRDIVIR